MRVGPWYTATMISPNLSLGSNLSPGLSMTILDVYNPEAILIIVFGSALSIASCIDLIGPFS